MTAGTRLSVTVRGGRQVGLYWAKSCVGLRELRVSRWPGRRDDGTSQDFGNWVLKHLHAKIEEGGRDKEKDFLLFFRKYFREKKK
jgi:hypothetical protein